MCRFGVQLVVAAFCLSATAAVEVNVDPEVENMFSVFNEHKKEEFMPLLPFEHVLDPVVLPGVTTTCDEGKVIAPLMKKRMGNTLDIVSQNQTILHMKLRCSEAQFFYPNCTIDSNTKMFTAFDMQLEGVLKNSDFDIAVILNHYPTCNATLGDVSLVEMSNMSFKFLENKLPKVLSDMISNFLAKYNRKLLDDCVVRAVEESINRLTEIFDLCEIFHPNLRVNDEL